MGKEKNRQKPHRQFQRTVPTLKLEWWETHRKLLCEHHCEREPWQECALQISSCKAPPALGRDSPDAFFPSSVTVADDAYA